MGMLDLFNKVFPVPKSKKKKIFEPRSFENSLKENYLRKARIKIDSNVRELKKQKYSVLPSERNSDGSVNLPLKKRREISLDRRIDFLNNHYAKASEDRLSDSYLPGRIKFSQESDRKRASLREEKVKKLAEELNKGEVDTKTFRQKTRFYIERFNISESAIERLIKLRYFFSNPNKDKSEKEKIEEKEIQERQKQQIRQWINYLKINYSANLNFCYLVLRTILKYDLYWLDKNPDGSWFSGERRNKKTELDFPVFNPDESPLVIAKLHEYLAYLDLQTSSIISEQIENTFPQYNPENPMKQALEKGDIRELIWLIRENIKLSRIDYSQVLEKTNEEWLPVFSFENCKSENEKILMARKLAQAVSFSRGFCIKSPTTAYEYLKRGNLHVYNVTYKVDLNKGRTGKDGNDMEPDIREVIVPEIAIHTIRSVSLDTGNPTGQEIINPKEIHGNAPNQGINKEYLDVARKWVEESNFTNKDEFEIKFADAEIWATVLEKINNLKNGGEDLNARELKFLYQVYRNAETFEIRIENINPVSSMLLVRFDNLLTLEAFSGEQERHEAISRINNQDYEKMFGTTDVSDPLPLIKNLDSESEKNKVILGTVVISEKDLDVLSETEEITGALIVKRNGTKFTTEELLAKIKKLKRVGNVELTKEDRINIFTSDLDRFPRIDDPRIKKMFY